MKTFLLYEGDKNLSDASLTLRGVFSDEDELNNAAQTLILQRAEQNYCEDVSEDYDLEQFVYDETVHFAETLQTQYGDVKYIAKSVVVNQLF